MASAAYVVGATSAHTPFYFVNNMKEVQKYSREALLEQLRQPMAWTVTGGRHQLNRPRTAMVNGFVHRRLTQLGCCATGEFHRYDHISAPLPIADVPWQKADGRDVKCPMCDNRVVRVDTWQAWVRMTADDACTRGRASTEYCFPYLSQVIHVWSEHRHQLPVECRKELELGANFANSQLKKVCSPLIADSVRSILARYFRR